MLRGWALAKSWIYMLESWQGAWNCLADVVHLGGCVPGRQPLKEAASLIKNTSII